MNHKGWRPIILYEDPECLVMAKPAGTATLHQEESAVVSLESEYAPSRPVHRLDNDTTGCVLLAKTESAYVALRAQFEAQQVTKIYLAIVHGLTPDTVTITTPIAHHARKADRMIAVTAADIPHRGQPQAAHTHATTLRHCYPTACYPHPLSWIRVQITTGVRHQIRVHLASAGHALVGDALYGHTEFANELAHHLLHAWQLTFRSPATNANVTATTPIPYTMRGFAEGHGIPLPTISC